MENPGVDDKLERPMLSSVNSGARGWLTVLLLVGATALFAQPASAAIIHSTTHGAEADSLDASMSNSDLLSGLIATELPGDTGWHPANTDPADQMPALTDGQGLLAPSNLTGLLRDFPGAGNPTKSILYDLGGLSDIEQINIFSGNKGKDGRVFSSTAIYSSDDGIAFNLLGYFQSDPSGTVNSGRWGSTLVEISDSLGADLSSDSRFLQFDFYSVADVQGEMRDPFDAVNPFTGVDDGLSAAIVSPLIFEIDVFGTRTVTSVPEPAALVLFGFGLAGLGISVRRRRKHC